MNEFSPLRYPGGKGKLAAYLSDLLEVSGLYGADYIEPFAGGAAVALSLLFSERVRDIHINDIDPCVFAFWHSVVHNTDAFIERLRAVDITIETWLAAREIKRNPIEHDVLDVGFATFFLSRTNRSGILNGGVIGGLKQDGKWKIGCRFNKEALESRIRRIGFFRSRIFVQNIDAEEFLMKYVPSVSGKKFLYIDPPYYEKGACLYENHYTHADHISLMKKVSSLRCCEWVVSYDNSPQIRQMYDGYVQEEFSINYSARSYAKGSEVMIFSEGITRPNFVYCSKKQKSEQEAA